jgi:hypothetical protein
MCVATCPFGNMLWDQTYHCVQKAERLQHRNLVSDETYAVYRSCWCLKPATAKSPV